MGTNPLYLREHKEFTVSAYEAGKGIEIVIEYWDGESVICRSTELPVLIETLIELAEFLGIPLDF